MALLHTTSRPLTGEEAAMVIGLMLVMLIVGKFIERRESRRSRAYWDNWLAQREKDRQRNGPA